MQEKTSGWLVNYKLDPTNQVQIPVRMFISLQGVFEIHFIAFENLKPLLKSILTHNTNVDLIDKPQEIS